MKSFVTRVSVGEFSAEGEGNSKKLSKKRAATTVLQELKKLPPLPVVEKPKLFFKKRPKTIVKVSLCLWPLVLLCKIVVTLAKSFFIGQASKPVGSMQSQNQGWACVCKPVTILFCF